VWYALWILYGLTNFTHYVSRNLAVMNRRRGGSEFILDVCLVFCLGSWIKMVESKANICHFDDL